MIKPQSKAGQIVQPDEPTVMTIDPNTGVLHLSTPLPSTSNIHSTPNIKKTKQPTKMVPLPDNRTPEERARDKAVKASKREAKRQKDLDLRRQKLMMIFSESKNVVTAEALRRLYETYVTDYTAKNFSTLDVAIYAVSINSVLMRVLSCNNCLNTKFIRPIRARILCDAMDIAELLNSANEVRVTSEPTRLLRYERQIDACGKAKNIGVLLRVMMDSIKTDFDIEITALTVVADFAENLVKQIKAWINADIKRFTEETR